MLVPDEAKQIQATINKTYACFSAVLSSLLSANLLLSGYGFLCALSDYLTYHGIDEPSGKSHDTDLKTVIISGLAAIVILLALIFSVKAWIKYIKALDKKKRAIVISLIIYIVSLPIFTYISLIFYSFQEIIIKEKNSMAPFIIALVILIVAGIVCSFAPHLFVRADQRDDPEAVAQAKKLGPMMIAFAVGAVLLMLKYKLT